jgi:hypothetical protein
VRRLALILALFALALAAAASAAPNPANQAALDRTVRYLQEAQQADGGFGAGGEPSQITSAWTALALAAAGINPQDQRRPGGVDAFAFLAGNYQEGIREADCAPLACTTTFERELMVVNASGAAPHDFGGVDLVRELLGRARSDGSFPHVPGGQPGVNDTIFAIFALAPVAEPAAQAPIQDAAGWIEAAQLDDGGWAWSATSTQDEVDIAGAAIQALVAAGRGDSTAVRDGLAYLRAAQNPDGGFPAVPGDPESNVASTAWATQAIWAVGENPEGWRTGSGAPTEEPLDYIESLQEPDGHVRWKRSRDLNGVWMTAYTTPALAGQPWPIPAPPRAPDHSPPPRPGQGGGSQRGAGVIAGGGGKGAPLFSRPRPQSKGRTPGGARVIRDDGAAAVDHSETRRGENARQPEGTAASEATDSRTPAPARVGSAGVGLATKGGDGEGGDEVTGTLVGSAGAPFFGAPGLHGAGAGDRPPWTALGIGAAALLIGLLGARAERRRPDPLPGVPA